MRKVAGLSACAVIIICFFATTVLAAFPYIDLVPNSERLEGMYIGSTLCYRASIAGTLGEGGGGFTSYLQSRVYQGLTLIKSSAKVRMWGTPKYATVFSIHIPIAFASLLAPLMGIVPSALLLLPLHVVLLELIIDPTCSVVLERQPAETDIMDRPPRRADEKLLNTKTLLKSVIQGIMIFAASFGTYITVLAVNPENATVARAMGLAIIMLSNLLLVQVNCSDHDPVWKTFLRLGRYKVMWAVNLGTLFMLAVILYSPLSGLLKLAPLSAAQILSACRNRLCGGPVV